jgi:phosphoribosyl-AMP cyclohydrolase
VAQHADTGEILMLAWMNDEALKLTVETEHRPLFQPLAQ